jgi:hypothetical protein
MDTLKLAEILHECGRKAVLGNKLLNKNEHKSFVEWNDLPKRAKEGRIIQAEELLKRLVIIEITSKINKMTDDFLDNMLSSKTVPTEDNSHIE